MCVGWPDSKEIAAIYEKWETKQLDINTEVVLYLQFSFFEQEAILNFFDRVLSNYIVEKADYQYFIYPLKLRLKRDVPLQEKLKERLLAATTPTTKVSYYALIKEANSIDERVEQWKKAEIECYKKDIYGYNIITNKVICLSDLLFPSYY